MREFKSIGAFAKHLAGIAATLDIALEAELKHVAKGLEKEAKNVLGTYQREDMGPFPGWAELADATKDDRVSHGYPENEPLLRSGELRDSIESSVEGLSAVVGSDSKIAIYQEMGTPDARHPIPPRPFLSLAVVRSEAKVKDRIGDAIYYRLSGQKVITGEASD